MPLDLHIQLGDEHLEYFRHIMRETREGARARSYHEILQAAEDLLKKAASHNAPDFVANTLEKLEVMLAMVRDEEWQLPEEEVTRVMHALAYFADPEDLIPDDVPGIGQLDDAIMVELVSRELKGELDAYADFCAFRSTQEEIRRAEGESAPVTRDDWLAMKRSEVDNRRRRGGR
ncbi:hypothetical protein BH24PSE2_BH24PSE2_02130 [soil metagenome]